MCLNPITLPNGQAVSCKMCWQCKRNRVDDWTGRCVAEALVSVGAHSVTLTYGRDDRYESTDHLRAAVLTYSDVQKMFKRMRRHGLVFRYMVVGEYGSMKGRSHWHCLFFWKNAIPIVELLKPTDFAFWDHGHTYWEPLTAHSVAYVCKYIAKETVEDGALFHLMMSKRPPLGDAFFRRLAGKYIADRLAPQDFFYEVEGCERKGKLRRFRMQGKTRENFLRYFRDGWWEAYGDHPPNSEILEEFEDLEAEAGSQDDAQRVLAAEKVGLMTLRDTVRKPESTFPVPKPKVGDLRQWMKPERLHWSESLNVWLYDFESEQRPWYWARNAEGDWGWRSKIGASVVNDSSGDYLRAKRGA